jgi:hypothetical protein
MARNFINFIEVRFGYGKQDNCCHNSHYVKIS